VDRELDAFLSGPHLFREQHDISQKAAFALSRRSLLHDRLSILSNIIGGLATVILRI
jgi:hypothetical protein